MSVKLDQQPAQTAVEQTQTQINRTTDTQSIPVDDDCVSTVTTILFRVHQRNCATAHMENVVFAVKIASIAAIARQHIERAAYTASPALFILHNSSKMLWSYGNDDNVMGTCHVGNVGGASYDALCSVPYKDLGQYFFQGFVP
ncbi:hypothetical protein Q1695_000199 [Nippostrongylus brasiliensis]|nr:hypothetical protein Q1695_000199 [Nippostrongylus brasiliensis]